MLHSIDAWLGRATAAWIAGVLRRRRAVVAGSLLASAALLPIVLTRLAVNSDEEALFGDGASYRAARDDFRRAFPALYDPLIVVIDGATARDANDAASRLRERLEREPELFPTVIQPDSGPFFETHGLLYLERSELGDVLDRLVEAQPYLGTLARDPTLRGLFAMLAQAAEATARGELRHFELIDVFDTVGEVVRGRLEDAPRSLDWSEILLGEEVGERSHRRILLVEPVVDFAALEPAGASLARLRQVLAALDLRSGGDASARVTGLFALSQEEVQLVSSQARWAGGAALVLVTGVLVLGLRSARMTAALLTTLVVGLLWTGAFAALAVGHLNLISVAFGVLFIGLSVDFGIHLCVRFRELLGEGHPRDETLVAAGRDVGGSLVICALTTAIGFFAFLGTDFRGVAELGLIAGTGMGIGLVANLTLLPALLLLGSARPFRQATIAAGAGARRRLLDLPLRHPRGVLALSLAVAGAAALLAPRARFDGSPLRVRDPSAESVQAFEDLLADGMAHPWNVNVLAPSLREADRLAADFESLPTVDRAMSLRDYVPEDQEEKLAWIDDVAFILLPALNPREAAPAPSLSEQVAAIARLEGALAGLEGAAVDAGLAVSGRQLREVLSALVAQLEREGDAARVLLPLESDLLRTLPGELRVLRSSLEAGPVRLETLPETLRRQGMAPDKRVRIELFPSEDLNDNAALEHYVRSIRSGVSDAFGEGIVVYEVGRSVVRAFRQALVTAALLIVSVLVLLWRNLRDAALVAAPIALAALLTVASTVLLDMPFNFANVIVIPLLMGMGVDTGVHLVHRMRSGPVPGGDLLHTSTARAVLLSAATTVASFGTLSVSTHVGMASLGRLLALGITFILLCNLIVLAAIVRIVDRPRGGSPSSGAPFSARLL